MKKSSLKLWLLAILCAVPFLTMAQVSVTGRVVDAGSGQTLPGVSVFVRGTTIGTATDINGNFSISVPSTTTQLVFSFVGYSTQTVVASTSPLEIRLREDIANLSEVVVTGLATSVKRSNLANAITTISAKELTGRTTPTTVDGALSGKIPGVVIRQNGGGPGGGYSMQLRGISTLTGASQPLFIVDGIYVNNSQFQTGAGLAAFSAAGGAGQDNPVNRIADINPDDIESIEVLKGASAAAIYGTRANAGVVIITTKRGKSGRTTVSFGQDVGVATPVNLLGQRTWSVDKINEYFAYFGAQGGAANMSEIALFNAANGQFFDYEKEIFDRNALQRKTRFSVSGGNENTTFFVSGNTGVEDGLAAFTGSKNNSVRANINQRVGRFVDVRLSSNYLNTFNSRSFTGNSNNGIGITYGLAYIPSYHQLLQNADGTFPNAVYGENPLAVINRTNNNETTNRFLQSVNGNIRFFNSDRHSVRLNVQGGVDYLLTENFLYIPDDLQSQIGTANPGAVRKVNNRSFQTNLQALIVYDANLFDSKLNVTTQAGTVRNSFDFDINAVQGVGLAPRQNNPVNGRVQTINSFQQSAQDVGFIAQQEYNYMDQFIATAGVRFDKSSLNGDNTKYFAFPKGSLAINLTNFDFWGADYVSQFKLRAAYGETGNPANFGALFSNLTAVVIGGNQGTVPALQVGNKDLEPERAKEFETGFDLGFLGGRINLEATYYNKKVVNLLDLFITAPSTGVTSIASFPVGDLRNQGVELSLNANPVRNDNFSWNTTTLFSLNRTKVTRITIPTKVTGTGFGAAFGTNRFTLGESPSVFYGLPAQPITDANRTGLTRYGESQPDFQMSFNNSITFLKDFEFSFLLHWKQGGNNVNLSTILKDEGGTAIDFDDDTEIPGLPGSGGNGIKNGFERLDNFGVTAAHYIEDATYVKLREASLYYTIPSSVRSKIFKGAIQNARIGVSGSNLLTFTNYSGYDPEVSNFGNTANGAPVEVSAFPLAKKVFFHLSFDF